MSFNAYHVYGIDGGEINYAHRDVQPFDEGHGLAEIDYELQFTVTGLHDTDFAIFAQVDGRELDYLVVDQRRHLAEIVNSTLVMHFPENFVTRSLAMKLKSVSRAELEEFSLGPVLDYMDRAFPSK